MATNVFCPNCGNYFPVMPDVCPFCMARLGAPVNPNSARELLESERAKLMVERANLTKRITALDALLSSNVPDYALAGLGFDTFRCQGGDLRQ